MKYLVTAEEMRRYDAHTIEKIGIPGMVLMERAALAARDLLAERFGGRGQRVLVMAGVGNNGGDGLALARLLSEAGFAVDVWQVGDKAKATPQCTAQRDILNHYEVKVCDTLPSGEYTILVDALFGVGLAREVTGAYAEALEAFNRKKGYKLALDVPSGVDASTGKIWGCAVKADTTVTFGFAKRGLCLYPGAWQAGEIRTADIGITEKSFAGGCPEMFFYESVWENMPERISAGNKGSFGKVLLIAGGKGMAGAAVLAAKAAYRSGAGMVRVLTAPENRLILQETVPEGIFGTFDELEQGMAWADVIAIGPGLGKSPASEGMLARVVRESALPLVIDADGLNLLAKNHALQRELAAQGRGVVLTPHAGELARLLEKQVPELKERLWEHGMELAERLHAVVAAKDARTFICQEGKSICVNLQGNSGMATAGSGDVLAGVIAGLLGQFVKSGAEDSAYRAACQGVLLHAAAGDLAAAEKGEHACMAGDIAEALADVLCRRAEDKKSRMSGGEGNGER